MFFKNVFELKLIIKGNSYDGYHGEEKLNLLFRVVCLCGLVQFRVLACHVLLDALL